MSCSQLAARWPALAVADGRSQVVPVAAQNEGPHISGLGPPFDTGFEIRGTARSRPVPESTSRAASVRCHPAVRVFPVGDTGLLPQEPRQTLASRGGRTEAIEEVRCMPDMLYASRAVQFVQ
eukprot:4294602-Prymnesium_polylepis.1